MSTTARTTSMGPAPGAPKKAGRENQGQGRRSLETSKRAASRMLLYKPPTPTNSTNPSQEEASDSFSKRSLHSSQSDAGQSSSDQQLSSHQQTSNKRPLHNSQPTGMSPALSKPRIEQNATKTTVSVDPKKSRSWSVP